MMLASSLAWAEDAGDAEREASPYSQHIQEGHRLFVNGSHAEALQAYQSALSEQPNDPMAIYLMGCAQRALSQWSQSLDSFQRAARLAGADDEALHARALMNVALLYEVQNQLSPSIEAWQVYIAYAESHQRVPTYVANARQRLEAIQRVQQLETSYTAVRQRIQEEANLP
jgi:tetratricopeptide (TPR) repeat protein